MLKIKSYYYYTCLFDIIISIIYSRSNNSILTYLNSKLADTLAEILNIVKKVQRLNAPLQ